MEKRKNGEKKTKRKKKRNGKQKKKNMEITHGMTTQQAAGQLLFSLTGEALGLIPVLIQMQD